ncbi:MAG: NAD(P)H-hydrate dehydratase [Paramuribaculum sp.]|nr:NAD(P)H-hydrate dehydratase [Paramuribaculum sp.]
MKLFSIEDIKAIERATLQQEGVTFHSLVMQMAASAATEIASRWRPSIRTIIFAGHESCGAVGLALAGMLMERGFNPSIYLFNIGMRSINEECKRCRDLLRSKFPDAALIEVVDKVNLPELKSDDLVIDALFGSELREPLVGGFTSLVRYINDAGATVVSIDVPSGMLGDWNHGVLPRDTVQASLTLSRQFPRLPFFFSELAERVGEWKVIDAGMNGEASANRVSAYYLIEKDEVRSLLRKRNAFSSKADYGTALLAAGSYGMTGAAVLACNGALRAGAGKVIVRSPRCSVNVLQAAVPEAMVNADDAERNIMDFRVNVKYTAMGVGPGIGVNESTIDALELLLKHTTHPLVLDADALNCIAQRPALLSHIPMLSVLTPHSGEFDRLFGEHSSSESRLLKAVDVSRRYRLLILLKGHYTTLVRPDGKIYINSSGTPGMATPGSGDVLTGVITSLMAQGYKPEVAALIGAFVHGKAGELAVERHGEYGVLASDIAANIGTAIRKIMVNE